MNRRFLLAAGVVAVVAGGSSATAGAASSCQSEGQPCPIVSGGTYSGQIDPAPGSSGASTFDYYNFQVPAPNTMIKVTYEDTESPSCTYNNANESAPNNCGDISPVFQAPGGESFGVATAASTPQNGMDTPETVTFTAPTAGTWLMGISAGQLATNSSGMFVSVPYTMSFSSSDPATVPTSPSGTTGPSGPTGTTPTGTTQPSKHSRHKHRRSHRRHRRHHHR